jgi:23S rRNA (uracil1939-C5)-methyltransferase
MEYKKNDMVRLEITDMTAEGMGVGKIDGYALFVKDAIVGDVLDVRIVKVKKNYGYGRVEKIIRPSSDRVKPRCPIARQCGGCQIQELKYDAQLKLKQNKVRNNLIRIGGFTPGQTDSVMELMIGMDDPWRYRNKAQYPTGTDKEGNTVAGFYAGRTHSIIPCTDCVLLPEENSTILEIVLEHMKRHGITAYDENDGSGTVRHVMIRKGFATGEIMVCLVITHTGKRRAGEAGGVVPEEYITGQNELIYKLCEIPGMKSVCVSVNNDNTNVIMGNETHTLYGSDTINDILLDKRFEISPLSFYQVNPVQVEKLYGTAIEYAGLTGNEEVWDVCCGIGTISICMSDKAKCVHGLEIVPEAIEDAKRNAALNNADNVEFICAAAEEYLPAHKDQITANVVVLDPPRKGMDEAALLAIVGIKPDKIVYVSCDGATLARDLKYLTGYGYELKKVRCTDMFSQTVHIETVCLLTRD